MDSVHLTIPTNISDVNSLTPSNANIVCLSRKCLNTYKKKKKAYKGYNSQNWKQMSMSKKRLDKLLYSQTTKYLVVK